MKKKIVMFSFIILSLSMIALISADANSTMTNSTAANAGNWSERCAAVDNRVAGLINQYNENNGTKRFSEITNILQNVITRAEARGYNVTTLQADQVILNEKITAFQANYSLFIQKLEDTRSYTCGHSEGEFQSALLIARAQLALARGNAQEVNQFKQTIREDVKALMNQAKAAAEAKKSARITARGNRT